MSTFTPDAGTLFYVRLKPRHVADSDGFTTTMRVVQDYPYSDDVFRCVGRDDTMVAATRLTGYFKGKNILFRPAEVVFAPVGPEIAAVIEKECEQ